jgi:hypothetical protein
MTKISSFYGFPDVPPLEKDGDATLYLSDDYVISRFYDSKKLVKTVICWDQIGRFGDDWSTICTLGDDGMKHKLSEERKSLQDYLRSSEIIKSRWNWPY